MFMPKTTQAVHALSVEVSLRPFLIRSIYLYSSLQTEAVHSTKNASAYAQLGKR